MKRAVKKRSKAELVRDYPIQCVLPGWFFRLEETSAGVYRAEGVDEWGRSVSRAGTEPERLLRQCEDDARAIVERLAGRQ
jgi:hypothetical protein